jgi:serralysin
VFGQVPLTWQIVGQRDLVGTGSSSILWRDNVGDLAVWLMSVGANGGGAVNDCGGVSGGGQIASVTSLGPIPTNLSVVGTGEFNSNGMGDILFQDANTGNLIAVLMNGATQLGSRTIGKVPTGYTVVGADRKGWVFLNNPTTNDVTIWAVTCPPTSNACTFTSTDIGTAPAQWRIKALADLDGNGITDIVWMDTSNNVGAWFMTDKSDAPTFVSSTVYGSVPPQWSIAQTGDMNGDGTADLLWTDTSGNVGAWFMQGKAISAVASYGNVGTSWAVQSLNSQ